MIYKQRSTNKALNIVKQNVFIAALGFVLSTTSFFGTQAYANTGFIPNSSANASPYGFTWNSTNGDVLDSTNSTQGMFNFDYEFESGSDWSVDLGQPTTYSGTVDINVYNANVRADKNVSLHPPTYGVFSGDFMTNPTNYYFTQPVDANYWYINTTADPNGLAIYDTGQQGVNYNQSQSSQPLNITTNENGSLFLTPTSID